MEFTILGDVGFTIEGRPIAIRSVRKRLILAHLLAGRGASVSSGHLLDALWEHDPPKSALENLRVYVYRLRTTLGAGTSIQHDAGGYRLHLGQARLDAARFEELVEQGDRARSRENWADAARSYGEALSLWRGRAFGDLADHPSLREESHRLEERRLVAQSCRIDAELALGAHKRLLPDLVALVAEHPFSEGFRAQLMLALYRSGRQNDALNLYQEGRRLLAEELGLAPGPELESLHRAILGHEPHLDLPGRAPGPCELPADPPLFTGRTGLVEQLTKEVAGERPIPLVISGGGGVGKSALAIHVAWAVRDAFPDGQLYLNLHGASPSVRPLQPIEALSRLLRSLGLDAASVPADTDEAAARFRALTMGRRLLIVLDNVRDAAQVRPLLPASRTCAVLVTSRRALASLEGQSLCELGVLSDEDSRALLTRLTARHGVPADENSLAEVARHCGHLPLAISIAAARVATRGTWTLHRLARRLSEERRRLAELEIDDRAVRASLQVSYRDLDPVQARLFRHLSLLDLPQLGTGTVADLTGLPHTDVENLLDRLADAHLVEAVAPGRYCLHDLTRLLARELAAAEDPAEDRAAAVRRALDSYLALARNASAIVIPVAVWRTTLGPATAVRPPRFADRQEVYAWVDAEAANLPAVVGSAAALGADDLVTALSAALFFPLYERGRWRELHGIAELAMASAERLGDAHHRAVAHSDIGYVLADLGRHRDAIRHLETSRELYHENGNRRGEAAQLDRLAVVHSRLGHFDDAIVKFRQSVGLESGQGNRFGEAITLVNLGVTYRRASRLEEAIDAYEGSLAITREIGDSVGTAIALGHLAEAHRRGGRSQEAVDYFRQALDADRAAGDLGSCTEAIHWWGLGLALDDLGRQAQARACWSRSAELLHELDLIDAAERSAIEASARPGTPEVILRNM
ncbi:tetratricopeptide repeat protein [Nonomuraea mesophila]|uniref:Tetratricopeptide repeat protein n=1 Tax=Nonomuraea mesophila TaxID=2530382 RepID=A0A4R5FJ31_9ACTN|nr:BTAD domain-containing putative transcriptional regulator [Nonomuraea mesophila]TDE51544.1 tetratricopeptide repeat protein [Nonomuraea mesophila]